MIRKEQSTAVKRAVREAAEKRENYAAAAQQAIRLLKRVRDDSWQWDDGEETMIPNELARDVREYLRINTSPFL